jgi:hypothetical protein
MKIEFRSFSEDEIKAGIKAHKRECLSWGVMLAFMRCHIEDQAAAEMAEELLIACLAKQWEIDHVLFIAAMMQMDRELGHLDWKFWMEKQGGQCKDGFRFTAKE